MKHSKRSDLHQIYFSNDIPLDLRFEAVAAGAVVHVLPGERRARGRGAAVLSQGQVWRPQD